MFTLNLKSSSLVFFSILLTSTQAFSAEKLNIQLQQSIDINCDGIAEVPYTSSPRLKISPQQCVMYKITAENTSQEKLSNIVINGNIPPYTQLLANSIRFYKNDELLLNNATKAKHSAQINSKPTTLSPHKILTVTYAVRVN